MRKALPDSSLQCRMKNMFEPIMYIAKNVYRCSLIPNFEYLIASALEVKLHCEKIPSFILFGSRNPQLNGFVNEWLITS